jgi:hypothetical protein
MCVGEQDSGEMLVVIDVLASVVVDTRRLA